MKKAIVAMSGGIDSSVCALLMKNEGFDTTGVTLRMYDESLPEYAASGCCNSKDIADAQKIAQRLGITHVVYDYCDNFCKYVIDDFVNSYKYGSTPNPCVECNCHVKFKAILDMAEKQGFDCVATGHYAIVEYSEKYGRKVLKKALDETKDQSYVLYILTPEQLSKIMFPLGRFKKSEIKKIAEENGFEVARKKESQDICFIKDGDYAKFIESYSGEKFESGDFVSEDGRILGKHKGIIHYTIGQRKGLGLSLPEPLYVKYKDVENNRIVLAPENSLFTDELYAGNVNLLAYDILPDNIEVFVKTRYKHTPSRASACMKDGRLYIKFYEPQRAITKGQSAVMYDSDGVVIGGGKIL